MRKILVCAVLMGFTLGTAVEAVAQGFHLPTSDYRLREDIALLVDEGVLELPNSTWPLGVLDTRAALSRVRENSIGSQALQAALDRVSAKVAPHESTAEWQLTEISLTAGEPGLLRDESTLGRDSAELRSEGGVTTDRWSLNLAVTGVGSPDDGKKIRLDGSELSIRWGNWLLSASQVERWWGPGHSGGLILSTSARPMPGLSLDRVHSSPFDFPALRWLGPWRLTAFLNSMEGERPDVDRPLMMGIRASFKPVPIIEIGVSRTAQFCGEGRPCDLSTFGRVLIGQDNAGIRGLRPEDEPGNQMAGFDLRVVSPFRALPVALYGEQIGEDGSNTGLPTRYLGLFGAEMWWLKDSGAVVRARIEYANTSCKWYAAAANADCAYRQGIFRAGYRYRGRNVGHTTDTDSESVSVSASLTRADGTRWAAQLRHAALDRYGAPDPFNTVTQGPSDFDSAEISWAGVLLKQNLALQLGYEKQEGAASDRTGLFGFIQWRKSL
jgi:hypothetical protein